MEYHKAQIQLVNKLTSIQSYVDHRHLEPGIPYAPYGAKTALHRVKRNLAILEALEGDVIDVAQLKTGRDFSIDSLFNDDF